MSSAVPLDTLRERRADRTGFAASADDERSLLRVNTFASTSSSSINTSLTSAIVSKTAPEAAVDLRRLLVDLVGVAVRSLGVAPALRRAETAGGSCLTLEAVFLVGLGVLRAAADFCAALPTAFLAGLGVLLLTTASSGTRFSGVFVVGLRTNDVFRRVPVSAERTFLGLGVAAFVLDRRGGVFFGLAGDSFLGLRAAASFLVADATAAAFFGLGVGSFFFGLGVASLLLALDAFLGRPGVLFGLSVVALRPLGLGV